MIGTPHPQATLGRGPVETIGREELRAKLDADDPIKLVMALNRWAYDAKHIPRSLHFDTPDELYESLDVHDEIVVYCSNVDCLVSVALYWALADRGYRNVRRYVGWSHGLGGGGLTPGRRSHLIAPPPLRLRATGALLKILARLLSHVRWCLPKTMHRSQVTAGYVTHLVPGSPAVSRTLVIEGGFAVPKSRWAKK